MKHSFLLISIFLFSFSLCYSQNNSLLLRFPVLNNDGSKIAFSFQGDIWTVSAGGGRASRLTVNEAYESNPKFSPNGKQIAFSGARFGNNDIFVMPADGGTPKRLTYNSAADNISSWGNDENILFSTNREYNQIERPSEVYAISSKGGTEWRVLDAVGFESILSPDKRFIAFVRGDINPVFRKDYRGSSIRTIWLFDTKNNTYTQVAGFETNNVNPQWSDSRTIYFLSSVTGEYNLYRIKIDDNGKSTGKPEKLTDYKDYSIRYFGISGDGKKIVFERDKSIYLMDIEGNSISKVNIEIGADDRYDSVEMKTFTNDLNEYAVSPNGKLIAFQIRGEIFVKEADKDKNRSINLSNSPYRDNNVCWLSDTTLIFTSDREDNNFEFYLVKSADKAQSNIFKSLKHQIIRLTKTDEDESQPVISNDGKKIAYVRGRGTLVTADISPEGKLSNETILLNGWSYPNGLAWSPDNKWLAYSIADLYFNEDVFIQAADNSKKPVNVSMHPRDDSNPFWSPDGSKLGFLSSRDTRNSVTNGLNHTNDVWFAWLKKEDWEKTKADWDDKETPAADKKEDKPKDASAKKEEPKVKPVQIDFDNIHERIVQVTSFSGDERDIAISKDGETFYYTGESSTAKGRDLYSIKWDGKDLKEITKGGTNPRNVYIDREGKYLYYVKQNGALSRQDIKADKSEALPYSAKMKIDYPAERSQIFEEAWRAMRDGFYDPKFHGKDWNAMHDKYKELCVIASTNLDFRDMFNDMLGELNSSHVGLYTNDRAETQKDATGLLGVELVPTKSGMKVIRVIPESPADRASSKLYADDVISAVDGTEYKNDENFYSLLNTKADDKILLTVNSKDGKEREVAIRPIANERSLLYKEWVKTRRALVDKYSGGRLGYIHIQGMDMNSFEVFERELTAAGYDKEGLVVDVRYNGGGSTTDYLMTILNYKQHAYTIPRGATDDLQRDKTKFRGYYPVGERLVFAAWLKPSIALCNEGSYSNAEIFSHAYKTLGIGKLVGVPTNGSVISTGGKGLIDGTFVRQPGRGWYVKANNQPEELGPAVPDITVYNTPDWIAKGQDDQLKAAVDELLKEIDSKK